MAGSNARASTDPRWGEGGWPSAWSEETRQIWEHFAQLQRDSESDKGEADAWRGLRSILAKYRNAPTELVAAATARTHERACNLFDGYRNPLAALRASIARALEVGDEVAADEHQVAMKRDETEADGKIDAQIAADERAEAALPPLDVGAEIHRLWLECCDRDTLHTFVDGAPEGSRRPILRKLAEAEPIELAALARLIREKGDHVRHPLAWVTKTLPALIPPRNWMEPPGRPGDVSKDPVYAIDANDGEGSHAFWARMSYDRKMADYTAQSEASHAYAEQRLRVPPEAAVAFLSVLDRAESSQRAIDARNAGAYRPDKMAATRSLMGGALQEIAASVVESVERPRKAASLRRVGGGRR